MSAEGILADPCIFYTARHSLCSCASLVSCAHDKRNISNITEKVGYEDDSFMTGGSDNKNRNKDTNENENEDRSGNFNNVTKTKSSIIRVPDRNALFFEYCVLSGMFLTAGGWRNIGMKDVTFDGSNDSRKSDSNTNCSGSGSGDCNHVVNEEMIGDCFERKNDGREENENKIKESMIFEGKIGITDTVESDVTATVKTVRNERIVDKADEEVEEERMKEIEKEKEDEKEGVEKQIEVARQHLYWMLEKKGHGRTVRFVHRGTYARHTDLLNDLKSAHTLEALQQISKICLTNVFGSNIYTNDSYDDY